MFKNVASQKVTLRAYDASTGLPKAGDAANITFYYNGDDGGVTVFSTSSGHPSEDDATNAPGDYTLAVTQGETNYNKIRFSGKSSTSNVVIVAVTVYTVPPNFTKLAVDSSAGGVTLSDGVTHGGSTANLTASVFTLTTFTVSGNVNFQQNFTVTSATTLTGAVTATNASNDVRGIRVAGYASGQAPLQPTVAGRTLDVSAGGEAGVDWANVGSPSSAVSLTGTTISTSQAVASVTGNVGGVAGVSFPANFGALAISAGGVADANVAAWLGNATLAATLNGYLQVDLRNIRGSVVTEAVAGNLAAAFKKFFDVSSPTLTTAGVDQTGDAYARIGNTGSGLTSLASAADAAAIKAKTDALPPAIKKNAALAAFEFLMVDAADHVTGKTGLAVTAQRSIDGAAFGACANAVSEVGSGVYKINLAAGDLNGNVVTLLFTAAGADARVVTVFLQS